MSEEDNEEYEFDLESLIETDVLVLSPRKAYNGTVKKIKGLLIVVDVTEIENFYPEASSDRIEYYEDDPIRCIFSLLAVTLEILQPIEDIGNAGE